MIAKPDKSATLLANLDVILVNKELTQTPPALLLAHNASLEPRVRVTVLLFATHAILEHMRVRLVSDLALSAQLGSILDPLVPLLVIHAQLALLLTQLVPLFVVVV